MKEIGEAISLLVAGIDLFRGQRWHHACLQFAKDNQVVQRGQQEESWGFRKREVLIQAFGRAKGLL